MMRIFDQIFKRHHKPTPVGWMDSSEIGALLYGKGSYRTNQAMKLSAVYRCVNCISDSAAQLPLEIYRVDKNGFKKKDSRNPLYSILNYKPNKRMTRYTFISLLIQSMLLKGNGYGLIKRDRNGDVKEIIFVPADNVTVVVDSSLDLEGEIRYRITGYNRDFKSSEIIHILNQSVAGVIGISTLEYARHTLGLAQGSERHAGNFFDAGCAVGGILSTDKTLGDKQKIQIKRGWLQAFGRGGESNGVAVLEGGLRYQPVTVNAKDAQLLETREFNVIDICRFFGVSPVKAFDLSKSSYSTVEATNISFLTDTLAPLLEKIELELETKLFGADGSVDVRFDVSQLLRADKRALATYYSTMFQLGVYSPNEIRRELDLPRVVGGDENYVQVNLQALKKTMEGTPAEDNNVVDQGPEKIK